MIIHIWTGEVKNYLYEIFPNYFRIHFLGQGHTIAVSSCCGYNKPMTFPDKQPDKIQGMFTRIAGRYDLMNRLMTFGQDKKWRKEVIHRAGISPSSRLLDLGTGTGDLTREAQRQQPGCSSVAADFTLGMMRAGDLRGHLNWSAADALHLPFPEASFDAVVSGFLMRNALDVSLALQEQHRVLTNGGRIVILDTTHPPRNLLTPFLWLHLHLVIPLLGALITGQREAYTYLPESTEKFLYAEQLASALREVGFKNVAFRRRMLGTIAIHWGEK
ncbi:MAG: ubiquinone/menaquinone biosynthesis methyltransferase [Chloroflexota bacterium]